MVGGCAVVDKLGHRKAKIWLQVELRCSGIAVRVGCMVAPFCILQLARSVLGLCKDDSGRADQSPAASGGDSSLGDVGEDREPGGLAGSCADLQEEHQTPYTSCIPSLSRAILALESRVIKPALESATHSTKLQEAPSVLGLEGPDFQSLEERCNLRSLGAGAPGQYCVVVASRFGNRRPQVLETRSRELDGQREADL